MPKTIEKRFERVIGATLAAALGRAQRQSSKSVGFLWANME
jgi:hypothetical protein